MTREQALTLTPHEVELLNQALTSLAQRIALSGPSLPNISLAAEVVAGLQIKLKVMLQEQQGVTTSFDANELLLAHTALVLQVAAVRSEPYVKLAQRFNQ